jgi:hypothetical protein
LVALGFLKNDGMVLTISYLDLLESGERYGESIVKEGEENVVIVSQGQGA